MRPVLPSLLVLLAGCAASPAARMDAAAGLPSSAPAAVPASGDAPLPYTAEEIRHSNPPGTKTVYRVETEGQPTVLRTTWFVTDDGRSTTLESETSDPDGHPMGEIQKGTALWTELRDHARFPAAATVRTDGVEVQTAAGEYSAILFEVRRDHDGAPALHRFWFDRHAAGSPVLYEIEQEGRTVFRMELLEENRRRLEG